MFVAKFQLGFLLLNRFEGVIGDREVERLIKKEANDHTEPDESQERLVILEPKEEPRGKVQHECLIMADVHFCIFSSFTTATRWPISKEVKEKSKVL